MSHINSGGISGNVWQTALDIDFTVQSSQTLAPDGNYTVDGITFTKINSANEVSNTVLTNGTGIVFTPTSAANYYGNIRTLPALFVPLVDIIPTVTWLMRLRVWMYVVSGNWAAQYDFVRVAVERTGTNTNYNQGPIFYEAKRRLCDANANDANCGQVWTTTAGVASATVDVIDTMIAGANRTTHLVGTWAGGWPTAQNLTLVAGRSCVPANTYLSDIVSLGSLASWNVLIGAGRAGSGTAFTTTIGALKVEYLP